MDDHTNGAALCVRLADEVSCSRVPAVEIGAIIASTDTECGAVRAPRLHQYEIHRSSRAGAPSEENSERTRNEPSWVPVPATSELDVGPSRLRR